MDKNTAKRPDTGNASNPSPLEEKSPGDNQLFDKKAEKYICESGNIEDMPDAQEEQETNDEINKESGDEKAI